MFKKLLILALAFCWLPSILFSQSEEWTPPEFSERQTDRNEMVEEQLIPRNINDQDVLKAMREVPRHMLVPENLQRWAYGDRPLPIGYQQTISQPFIVAFMTQTLNLEHGDKVLEIGTGSGYQAAVLSHITPNVYTIEIVEELGNRAKRDLNKLGYTNIEIKIGDGYHGWKEHAPFDGIVVTAAPEEIPDPLIEQLKPGGTLVIPVGESGEVQNFMKVTKSESGEIQKERLMAVRFVPMTGEAQN